MTEADGGGGGGGEGERRGYGGGAEREIIYLSATLSVTTRMISASRWAAMRAILMFHNCEGQSRKTVSTDHNF